jgi:tetratricopeptide (TPR) repeat protein
MCFNQGFEEGERMGDPREIFGEGQQHLLKGELEESVKSFTSAIEAGMDEAIAYLSRGVAYMKLKKPVEAAADFSKAIERSPQSDRAYYYRASALMLSGEYGAAVPDLDRAIEINPENGAAFFARATCHVQLGNEDEASRDMKTAIAMAETAAQGLADTFGIIRTHFDMAMALLSGERRPSSLKLTEKEQEQLRKWLEEGREE